MNSELSRENSMDCRFALIISSCFDLKRCDIKMELWKPRFSTISLSYTYVHVPELDEPPNYSLYPICYYVNRVIINLTHEAF